MRAAALPVVLTLLFLAACSSTPRTPDDKRIGDRAAQHAVAMKGKPYRYGGNSPGGFDCSGLVQYSYARAGAQIPRSTEQQWRNSRAISPRQLRRGDLVFFNQEGKRYSHVGLYLGDNRFVHAPSSGKSVSIANLDDRYWQRHFEGARRPLID